MGAPAIQSSICDTDEILELQDLGGTLRFGSESELRNYIENTAARSPRRKVRAFGGSNREINEMAKPTLDSCEDNKISNEDLVAERLDDVLAVGATSVADLDNLIKQLQDARDYLQAESERVRLANERYAHLARAASASAKIITDSMGQWRNSSPALSRSPIHDTHVQLEQRLGQS
jgi:Holliday junction resolvase RusA-like endonuclease